MDKADILHDIRERLVQDFSSVISDVKEDYKSELSNIWVFDYLNELLKKLQSPRVDKADYRRKDFEHTLNELVDKQLSSIQRYVPEIKTEDIQNLISVAGDLYDLVCLREKAELSGLESSISKYESSKQLMETEFDKSKAFDSKEKHQEWITNVSKNLEVIFDYVEDLGQTLAEKRGLIWAVKLSLTKNSLKSRLGVDLNLASLAEDVSIAKEAFLNKYHEHENKLIESRYSRTSALPKGRSEYDEKRKDF